MLPTQSATAPSSDSPRTNEGRGRRDGGRALAALPPRPSSLVPAVTARSRPRARGGRTAPTRACRGAGGEHSRRSPPVPPPSCPPSPRDPGRARAEGEQLQPERVEARGGAPLEL